MESDVEVTDATSQDADTDNISGSSAKSVAYVSTIIEEFQAVLGREISGTGDFFSLGGSSLLAVRVAAGIGTRCGKLLTLADVLRLRTPAAIAAHLATAPDLPGHSLPAAPAGETQELSPPQHWYSQVYQGERAATAVMSFAVELPDGTTPATVWPALRAVVAAHDSLRTSVRPEDGRLVQCALPDLDALLTEPAPEAPPVRSPSEERPASRGSAPVIATSTVSGGREAVARAAERLRAEIEAGGIALDGGPLWRAALVLGADPGDGTGAPATLMIVVHHLIFDGPSVPVVTGDLLSRLRDSGASRPPAASYRDYTAWRLSRETRDTAAAERDWWRERLAGSPPAHHLPGRTEPDRNAGYASGLTVPGPVRAGLAATATRLLVPVSALRAAAFFLLCHALYDTDDMIIGMPVDSRDHPALDGAVGMFTNHALLRHRMADGESVRELAEDVADELVTAVEHKSHRFDLAMAVLGDRCPSGRFPISGAVINGAELDAPPWQPLTDPVTEELSRCNRCDFQIYVADSPGRLDIEVTHRADILSAAEGVATLRAYSALLAAVADPDPAPVHALVERAKGVLHGDR